jgi:RhoGAP domain
MRLDYPDLEGDEIRRAIWLVDVSLVKTHLLRAQINDGKPITHEVLEKFEIPVIASALKLYLLELPDPIVASHTYEIFKTIYSTSATDSSESARVSVIQNTLGTMRLANIATLDAITTHFTRLIELTSADETYISALATNLAPCILRPKQETSLTMDERFSYRLLRDLFAHKEAIFGELKRASSLKMREAATASTTAAAPRGRGMSSVDEGRSRRELELERQQAINAAANNRSRATSPAPGSRIKRERSPHRMSGSADTRFPVAVNTSSPTERRSTVSRHSLEVPGQDAALPVEAEKANGGTQVRPVGVELTDRPMDD